jgi:hypothetical protein
MHPLGTMTGYHERCPWCSSVFKQMQRWLRSTFLQLLMQPSRFNVIKKILCFNVKLRVGMNEEYQFGGPHFNLLSQFYNFHLTSKSKLARIYILSPYRAVNTLLLGYTNQSVKAVQ